MYAVRGALFSQFDDVGAPKNVIIDLTYAEIWDASTVAALDAIQTKFESKGRNVEIVGLDGASAHMHDPAQRPPQHTLTQGPGPPF
ncbi:MAG TPA: STAS domain-containing protein [Nocardioidaceae bacterium]|nr:STAS domain-containing protein [Nocardioidaceae bacterium]